MFEKIMTEQITTAVLSAAFNLLTILQFALFITIILSWFPHASRNAFAQCIDSITRPMLQMTYAILPLRIGMIDLTPIVVFLILRLMQGIVIEIAKYFEVVLKVL